MTLSKRHRADLKRSRGSVKPEPVNDWGSARAKVDAEGACRACHATGELQAAHTIPRSLGGGQTAESVIPLCRGCHDDQHAGKLALLPLLTRAEEVEATRALGLARAYRYLTKDNRGASPNESEAA